MYLSDVRAFQDNFEYTWFWALGPDSGMYPSHKMQANHISKHLLKCHQFILKLHCLDTNKPDFQ